METLNLDCEKRDLGTKGKVRALRRAGKVPAVIYGPKTTPIPLAVAALSLKISSTGDAGQRRGCRIQAGNEFCGQDGPPAVTRHGFLGAAHTRIRLE